MIKLNREQQVAGTLQIINNVIGVIAFIPAFFCWFFTIFFFQGLKQDLFLFISSSLLLFVFYGYTLCGLRVYLFDSYNIDTSFWYWLIVLTTNLLTAILFFSIPYWHLAIVPAVPFLIAVDGLIAHLKINSKNQ
jgi:hypothetical protein